MSIVSPFRTRCVSSVLQLQVAGSVRAYRTNKEREGERGQHEIGSEDCIYNRRVEVDMQKWDDA